MKNGVKAAAVEIKVQFTSKGMNGNGVQMTRTWTDPKVVNALKKAFDLKASDVLKGLKINDNGITVFIE